MKMIKKGIRFCSTCRHVIIYNYCHFYLPNIQKLLTKKLIIRKYGPSCQQKTYVTGKGRIQIGCKCSFGFKMGGFYHNGSIELQARYENSFIKIGNRIATNNNLFICAANYIEIGNDVLIGQGVCFMDHEAHGIAPEYRRIIGDVGKIIIGNNVWIGNSVTILKNTEIGENSIVAAHAVVSGKFPNNVIIGGVPAKIIKEIKSGN